MLPQPFFANRPHAPHLPLAPMRNIQPENIAEHSLQVAMVAHALGLISNRLFGAPGMQTGPPSWPSTTTAARC